MFNFKDDDEENQIFLGNGGGSAPLAEPEIEEPELDIPVKPTVGSQIAREARDAQNQKLGVNLAGSIGDILGSGNNFGNYFLKQTNGPSTAVSGFANKVAAGIEDPFERREKAAKYMKSRRDEMQARRADDPTDGDASTYRAQIEELMPSLKGKLDGMTLAQMERTSPIIMAKLRGIQDEKMARIAAGSKAEERALARQDKLDAKELKQKELSATQAKQRGLYEMGKKAEEQYSGAVADKDNYDPTSVGQIIDNSSWAPNILKNNKAIEAQNAQKSWIESYLRDASGAAIPESERNAYADIYFPQPGDPEDVVKNKMALRAQKMDSARIAAGVETGHGPTDTPLASQAPKASPLKTAIQEEKARRLRLKNTAAR